jgi:hypothetical protein
MQTVTMPPSGTTTERPSMDRQGSVTVSYDDSELAWHDSPERRRAMALTVGVVAFGALVTVPAFVSTFVRETGSDIIDAVAVLIIGGLATALAHSIVRRYWRRVRHIHNVRRAVEMSRLAAEAAENETTAHEVPSLTDLWRATQKRLEYYHDLATTQAARSFASAQRAMWAGFVIVLSASVIAVAVSTTTTSSVIVGLLGAAGGMQAAYIARTFLRAQESASAHLRSYFRQPLEFSRFLAAERLVADLEEQARSAALVVIAQSIVTAGADVDSPNGNGPSADSA